MSIKHRALKYNAGARWGLPATPSLRGAKRRSNPFFSSRSDELLRCTAMTDKPRRSPLALAAHEIEIAAFVGLQDGLVDQSRSAAPVPFRRRDPIHRPAP